MDIQQKEARKDNLLWRNKGIIAWRDIFDKIKAVYISFPGIKKHKYFHEIYSMEKHILQTLLSFSFSTIIGA